MTQHRGSDCHYVHDLPLVCHADPIPLGYIRQIPGVRGIVSALYGVPVGDVWPKAALEHLAYFLERVVPVAEEAGMKMAIHPDDPPWSVFELPRIITDSAALERLMDVVDSPANGVTFCTGSLGALSTNDLPAMVRQVGARGRIHFAHCRNVKITGNRECYEGGAVPHGHALITARYK